MESVAFLGEVRKALFIASTVKRMGTERMLKREGSS